MEKWTSRLVSALVLAGTLAPSGPVGAQSVTPTVTLEDDQGVDVLGAFGDSLKLLLIEHTIRIAAQEKTRRELDGPFWSDYRHSLRVPHQWEDSDAWWVNYIGHPIHGASAGYIWLDHDPKAPYEIGLSRRYWATRAQAAAWISALQPAVRVRAAERSLDRQRRACPAGDDRLGGPRGDASRGVRPDRR